VESTSGPARPHTGRRRNEAVRRAILDAALRLLAESDGSAVTTDTIARAAGVGKQTLYRWWPSKGAVLLEAMVLRAEAEVPTPETGNLRADLTVFLRGTFTAATRYRSLLLGVLREALGDPDTYVQLERFAASRRAVLGRILEASHRSGGITSSDPIDTVIDQTFGLLWYRLIFASAPLDSGAAAELVDALITQLQPSGRGSLPSDPGDGRL
jgi:AcrR family transcriptional regulator